jgi:hypothetical protein
MFESSASNSGNVADVNQISESELSNNKPPLSDTSGDSTATNSVAESNNVAVSPPPQSLDEMPFVTDSASAMAASNFRQPKPQSQYNIDDSNSPGGVGAGGWFGKILGGNKGHSEHEKTKPQMQSNLPPPPRRIPPPPPLPGTDAQKLPPPPWMYQQQQHQQQPTPPNFPGQQQPYNPNNIIATNQNNYIDPELYRRLLYDLDESTLREMTLTHELHNVTVQLESLLIRTDILTERLADNEANFNYVHNRNIELDANCTALTKLVSELQRQMETYEAEKARYTEADQEKDKTMKELREELRKVTDELEQLACLVETERFEDEKITYLENLKKKQQQKRKKRGFWSWLFGFSMNDSVENDYESMEESERTRAARELARSTLLHALQSERASVEELEAAVATLQRNNSAIMDVVESRNSLISELNERVAVFEDDKMVLKAALRQLQKEIKEEAPKTQLLVDELEEARRELELKELEAHEWEKRFIEMQAAENETKEELELIGTYVDQLEDRLATFAVARREIELREKKCEQLEEEAKNYAQEINDYKSKVEELTKEKEESKLLLQDLMAERAKVRRTVEKLKDDVKQLNEQINDWKDRLAAAEKMCDDVKSESARQLFLKIEEEKSRAKTEIGAIVATKDQEVSQLLSSEKAAWQARISEEWAQREAKASEDFERRLQTEKALHEAALKQALDQDLQRKRDEVTAFQNEMQQKFDEERAMWGKLKDEEISQRLSEERELWESSLAAANVKVDDEIERAAAKVYDRLEQRGVSFDVSDISAHTLDLVSELLKSKIAKEEEEQQQKDQEGEQQEEHLHEDDSDSDLQINHTFHDNQEESSSNNDASNALSNQAMAMEEVKQLKPVRSIIKRRHQQRKVPFRVMRKAFARATGIHGMFSPSTVQLRQQMSEGNSSHQKNRDGKNSFKDEGANELFSIQTKSSSRFTDEVHDVSELESELDPGVQYDNSRGQVHESSHDTVVLSWGGQSSDGYDTADEEASLSNSALEPPLPDNEIT